MHCEISRKGKLKAKSSYHGNVGNIGNDTLATIGINGSIKIVQSDVRFSNFSYRWSGKCYWGICTTTLMTSSPSVPKVQSHVICISGSEDTKIKGELRHKGYQLVEAAGAGYKTLAVITGLADAYILSKNSTFKWDTCGPQAILRALGGDLFNYTDAAAGALTPVTYKDDCGHEENGTGVSKHCNMGGIIACRDSSICKKLFGNT